MPLEVWNLYSTLYLSDLAFQANQFVAGSRKYKVYGGRILISGWFPPILEGLFTPSPLIIPNTSYNH